MCVEVVLSLGHPRFHFRNGQALGSGWPCLKIIELPYSGIKVTRSDKKQLGHAGTACFIGLMGDKLRQVQLGTTNDDSLIFIRTSYTEEYPNLQRILVLR